MDDVQMNNWTGSSLTPNDLDPNARLRISQGPQVVARVGALLHKHVGAVQGCPNQVEAGQNRNVVAI